MDDILVASGGAIKALGHGRYEMALVLFGDPANTDLVKDYFTKSTDFWTDFPARVPVLYDHGQDGTLKKRRLGTGELEMRPAGIWLKDQLDLADEYSAAVYAMIEQGRCGASSGSAGHLVERKRVGDAFEVTSWPLVEASITPSPAEPKTFGQVVPLKSLPAVKSFKAILQEMADAEAGAGEQAGTPDADAPADAPTQDAPEAETPEAVKSADPDLILDALEALPLKTFLEAMGAVASLTDRRLAWYAEQRETKQGRAISAENLSAMRDIHDGMKQHLSHLKDILDRHDPATRPKAVTAQSAYMDYLYAASHGGTISL